MSFYYTPAYRPQRIQSGFTLVELMVVIMIMAILATIAAPNITNALERQRNRDTAQAIVTALKEARAESLLRRQTITVNVATDGITLTDPNSNTLKNLGISANTPVTSSVTNGVQFRANKTVNAAATFTVLCNTKDNKKIGRVITVDVNGNVVMNAGASQC
ncbi:MAG: GspH/FimT family pseudopilin [Moraxella sp.]|nr:GspH/FimT family pseudopilin [Moraxella sp.]